MLQVKQWGKGEEKKMHAALFFFTAGKSTFPVPSFALEGVCTIIKRNAGPFPVMK